MSILQEFRWAARGLGRNVLSIAGVVLVLTLGIGVSTCMFSVLQSVVLRGLPYPQGDRIVIIYAQNREIGASRAGLTAREAAEGLASLPGFKRTAYYLGGGAQTLMTSDGPQLMFIRLVSKDYFSVYGLRALLGRTLVESDYVKRRSLAVLNYAAWTLLGRRDDVVGSRINFEEGASFKVVGVLPQSFSADQRPLLYAYLPNIERGAFPGNRRIVEAVGRLEEGVTSAFASNVRATPTAKTHQPKTHHSRSP